MRTHRAADRGDIERLEGRLRLLDSLSSMASVKLEIEEIKDYVPETSIAFGERVDTTFSKSLGNLVSFGKDVAIYGVWAGPWLPLAVVGLFGAWWSLRRFRKTS